jgi:ABC-type Fe3+-siderophore transport system permease subunit
VEHCLQLVSLYTGKKCKTCFYHFIIADWDCCKCNGIKRYRLYELYRKRPQARSITFWNLGTFSGASWLQVSIVGTVAAIMFIISFRYSKQLNALLLGEEEATYLGVDTDKLKTRIMILNTAMVSVATAFVGVISFMGLIVPHILTFTNWQR